MRVFNLVLFSVIVIAAAFALNGCKEDKSAQTNPASGPENHMESQEGHDHAAMAEMKKADSAVPAAEQEICPVMGGKIDKAIYTSYKGKKVYFCCAGCIEKFTAQPEKYLSELPQFNE